MKRLIAIAGALIVAQACDNNGPDFVTGPANPNPPPPTSTVMASYDVSVINLTNAQPLSPIAVIGHSADFAVFELGSAASVALEQLAEGGDNTQLLSEADANTTDVFATVSGGAAIGPAGDETVQLTLLDSNRGALRISVATMLVNTNDAISVLDSFDASGMAVGDAMSFDVIAYDAGTESDSEAAADIPGPAGGGEGFNALRDDEADRVAMHAGVVSQDDGFVGSDLTEQHRFDNPVARIRVTRAQ